MSFISLGHFLLLDGGLFVLIGIIVLINPNPQPTLISIVEKPTMPPFKDTRRLLATQFSMTGALLCLFGWFVHDAAILRTVALLRIVGLLLVLAVNVFQLRQGTWKPQSLYVLISIWILVILVYLVFLLTQL